jgi:FtsH-binding integral membrane protein
MAENKPLLGEEPQSGSRTVERPSNWKEAQKLGYRPQYSSEEVKKEVQKGFLLKVYGILSAQLAFTVAFCALFMAVEPLRAFVLGNIWIVIVLFIVTIVLIIALFFLKNNYPW